MIVAKSISSRSSNKRRAAEPPAAPTAGSIVEEVEKASETVLTEVKSGIGTVANKVADVARSSADTLADSQAGHLLKTLVGEIQEIGEGLLTFVAGQFERIRGKALEQGQASPQPATQAPRKKAAKKTERKAVAKRSANSAAMKSGRAKKVAKKAPAARKAATKKVTPRKKAASKKKAATRKKAAAKK